MFLKSARNREVSFAIAVSSSVVSSCAIVSHIDITNNYNPFLLSFEFLLAHSDHVAQNNNDRYCTYVVLIKLHKCAYTALTHHHKLLLN